MFKNVLKIINVWPAIEKILLQFEASITAVYIENSI